MDRNEHRDEADLVEDLLRGGRGAWTASIWAWEHRWEHLSTEFSAIEALAERMRLDDDSFRQLTLAAARRIHFAFAFETLGRFCREALERFPGEELLLVLEAAAGVARGETSWRELETRVERHPSEGIAPHVLLTAVYLAESAPRDVLERALTIARDLAERGDLVALYRSMSILRLLGRYDASLETGMRVNDELVSGRHPAALCDHLSERVLAERHLTIAAMRAQDARNRGDGLWNLGL
jgi:hypothetical protein